MTSVTIKMVHNKARYASASILRQDFEVGIIVLAGCFLRMAVECDPLDLLLESSDLDI